MKKMTESVATEQVVIPSSSLINNGTLSTTLGGLGVGLGVYNFTQISQLSSKIDEITKSLTNIVALGNKMDEFSKFVQLIGQQHQEIVKRNDMLAKEIKKSNSTEHIESLLSGIHKNNKSRDRAIIKLIDVQRDILDDKNPLIKGFLSKFKLLLKKYDHKNITIKKKRKSKSKKRKKVESDSDSSSDSDSD